jgi:hypothetical protein
VKEPQLWEIKSAGVVGPEEVPLLFREFKSASQSNNEGPLWRIKYEDEAFSGSTNLSIFQNTDGDAQKGQKGPRWL